MVNLWRSIIPAVVVAVGVGGVVTAVQLDGESSHASQSTPEVFSSQDVFRAVVFAQGDLAKQLADQPSLRNFYGVNYAANNGAEQLAAADEVMMRISAADPRYFTRFNGAVRSGDPYAVSDALGGVQLELQKAGFTLGDVVPAAGAPSIQTNFHINLNVTVNVNINVNENININFNLNIGGPMLLSGGFQRELAVGGITEALRA